MGFLDLHGFTAFAEMAEPEEDLRHVQYDNGPHMNSWPGAGMIPFRNEKDSNGEGTVRVPGMRPAIPDHAGGQKSPPGMALLTTTTAISWARATTTLKVVLMEQRIEGTWRYPFLPAQGLVAEWKR